MCFLTVNESRLSNSPRSWLSTHVALESGEGVLMREERYQVSRLYEETLTMVS